MGTQIAPNQVHFTDLFPVSKKNIIECNKFSMNICRMSE